MGLFASITDINPHCLLQEWMIISSVFVFSLQNMSAGFCVPSMHSCRRTLMFFIAAYYCVFLSYKDEPAFVLPKSHCHHSVSDAEQKLFWNISRDHYVVNLLIFMPLCLAFIRWCVRVWNEIMTFWWTKVNKHSTPFLSARRPSLAHFSSFLSLSLSLERHR